MKREVGNCPYRKPLESSPSAESVAACGVLARLSGIAVQNPLLEVSRAQCEDRCNEPVVASPTSLNPGVASYLFNLSCAVIEQGGVDGCSSASAKELQGHATRHLRHGETPEQESRRPAFGRRCLFLGARSGATGEDEPRFECRHEFHTPTTTEAKCRVCSDYDPELPSPPGVEKWAVGLTTAPRRRSTLATTLRSLAAAGWKQPTVFAEPGTRIANTFRDLKIVRRQETLGAWPNFLLGLHELVLSMPDADAYFMVQDDAVFVGKLREDPEASLWPHSHTGVVSLHTPSHQVPEEADREGFFPRKVGWAAWGAMAFVFSNASARAMLRHPAVVNHRSRGTGDGLRNVDSVVGHWCHLAGLEYYLHCPSLTQHIGLTTTLWSRDSLEGRRSSSDFPGEDFDARRLIRKATRHPPPPTALPINCSR